MVSKTYQVAEITDGCICDHSFCTNYLCGSNPHYNWLNPYKPLGVDNDE